MLEVRIKIEISNRGGTTRLTFNDHGYFPFYADFSLNLYRTMAQISLKESKALHNDQSTENSSERGRQPGLQPYFVTWKPYISKAPPVVYLNHADHKLQ